MKKIVMGIDPSFKSTGICIVDCTGNVLKHELIFNPKSHIEDSIPEELISEIASRVLDLVGEFGVSTVVIEGLAFSGKSAIQDQINGLHWFVRTSLYNEFPHVGIIVTPVSTWRKGLSIKKKHLDGCKGTDSLKIQTFLSLPDIVQKHAILYVEENCMDGKAVYWKAIYDMSDAYFIAMHPIKGVTNK